MRASLKSLLVDVCRSRCIAVDDLVGRSRARVLIDARREFVKRARRELNMSYPVIGRAMNRDHTTALYLYKSESPPLKPKDGCLTRSEKKVQALLRMGRTYAWIADYLNLKEDTVSRYARAIKAKNQ